MVKNLAVVSATHQHGESLNPKPLNTRGGREEKMTRIPEVSGVRSLQPSPPRQVKESEHFNCIGRAARLYADVEAGCKVNILTQSTGYPEYRIQDTQNTGYRMQGTQNTGNMVQDTQNTGYRMQGTQNTGNMILDSQNTGYLTPRIQDTGYPE